MTIRADLPVRLQSYSIVLALAFWLFESAMHRWVIRGWGTNLENVFPPDANELWMRVIVVALIVGNGAIAATLTRKLMRQQSQNERLSRELHVALLRNLSGLVSICMHCKSVRNPSEQWDSVERYLASRTNLQFSHWICARCFERYYSDLPQAQ